MYGKKSMSGLETQPPIKHLQNNIGQMLNKALDAIGEANAETLAGVFKKVVLTLTKR